MVLAVGEEVESGVEESDSDFIQKLATKLLVQAQGVRLERSAGLSSIEASSGTKHIDQLCLKLERIQGPDLDLSQVDYTCLEKVLSMLIKQKENKHEDPSGIQEELSKVQELRQKYEISQNQSRNKEVY